MTKIATLAWILTQALTAHPSPADSAISNAIESLAVYGHYDTLSVIFEYEDLAAQGNQNAISTLLLLQENRNKI